MGTRKVILAVTTLLGLTLIGAKLVGSGIAARYVFFIALGVATATVLPYAVVISHWFNRKRGMAMGLMMLGTGTGAIVVPPLAQG